MPLQQLTKHSSQINVNSCKYNLWFVALNPDLCRVRPTLLHHIPLHHDGATAAGLATPVATYTL